MEKTLEIVAVDPWQNCDDGVRTVTAKQCLDGQMFDLDSLTQFISFGDSLSDPGNAFSLTLDLFPFPPPPYFMGRFSNGPVTSELLGQRLNLSVNPFYVNNDGNAFAVGGSRTGRDKSNNDNLPVLLPGLANQIDAFEQSLGTEPADPNALYSVWAGPNDFLDYLAGFDSTDPTELLEQGVSNLVDAITRLSDRGAQNFVVPNLSLGSIPFSAGFQREATAISQVFNGGLSLALGNLKLPSSPIDASVVEVDIFSTAEAIAADPTSFGFSNVTTPLLFSGDLTQTGFFFWDEFHPTTEGHQIFAETIFRTLQGDIPQRSFNEIRGTSQRDRIVGTRLDDNIDGFAGNDWLLGRSGDDRIEGWQGKDWIWGGLGDDILSGGDHHDILHGGKGNDLVFGDNGNDYLFGNRGDDSLLGGRGRDRVWGNSGDDYILGGDGDDKLIGGRGSDILNGGRGKDYLLGSQGDDQLDGGAHQDWLYGGQGRDGFIFRPGSGLDQVIDFQPGLDQISLVSFRFEDFDDFIGTVDRRGTVLDFGAGDALQLLGTDVTVLTASDFIFA